MDAEDVYKRQVVAKALPSRARKACTCMAHRKEIATLAAISHRPAGRKATASRMAHSAPRTISVSYTHLEAS